jgi:hypothetical protein
MFEEMKPVPGILLLCVAWLVMACGCEKEKPSAIEVEIQLVNGNDIEIDAFREGDSVLFKFYLINHLGRDAAYIRPTFEIMDFLRVYRMNSSGEYEYLGNPSANFVMVVITDSIQNGETKLLGAVPTIDDFNWPEMGPGEYYVGDTFEITIEDERRYFTSRIGFTVE